MLEKQPALTSAGVSWQLCVVIQSIIILELLLVFDESVFFTVCISSWTCVLRLCSIL